MNIQIEHLIILVMGLILIVQQFKLYNAVPLELAQTLLTEAARQAAKTPTLADDELVEFARVFVDRMHHDATNQPAE